MAHSYVDETLQIERPGRDEHEPQPPNILILCTRWNLFTTTPSALRCQLSVCIGLVIIIFITTGVQ